MCQTARRWRYGSLAVQSVALDGMAMPHLDMLEAFRLHERRAEGPLERG